jgi:hypothetical protein
VLDAGAENALRTSFEGARRGEAFGNARFARTLFEQALNSQALRLAHNVDQPVAELEPHHLAELTAEDVEGAARSLGEEDDPGRQSRWRRRRV